jgi:hypothetical protein
VNLLVARLAERDSVAGISGGAAINTPVAVTLADELAPPSQTTGAIQAGIDRLFKEI